MTNASATFGSDWNNSNDYAYTLDLYGQPWGWEYLRRNPNYMTAWLDASPMIDIVARSERSTIYRGAFGAERRNLWHCLLTSAPQHPAFDATTFWNPQDCPNVLRAVAVARRGGHRGAMFCLDKCPLRSELLVTSDDLQHLVLRDGVRSLQMAITGASLLRPVHLTAEMPADPGFAKGQAWARRCFEDFQTTGHLSERHFRPLKSAARLRECLRVLDGRRAGASPRQIAVALFGAAKVEEEWNHPNQRLRDHVRNARKRGEFLMEGGYRTLLFKS